MELRKLKVKNAFQDKSLSETEKLIEKAVKKARNKT
jgi:hypothetical protein